MPNLNLFKAWYKIKKLSKQKHLEICSYSVSQDHFKVFRMECREYWMILNNFPVPKIKLVLQIDIR